MLIEFNINKLLLDINNIIINKKTHKKRRFISPIFTKKVIFLLINYINELFYMTKNKPNILKYMS